MAALSASTRCNQGGDGRTAFELDASRILLPASQLVGVQKMLAAAAAFAASSTEPAPIAATSRRGRALQVPDYVDPRCAPPPPFYRFAFAFLAVSPPRKKNRPAHSPRAQEIPGGLRGAAATLAALLVAGRRAA